MAVPTSIRLSRTQHADIKALAALEGTSFSCALSTTLTYGLCALQARLEAANTQPEPRLTRVPGGWLLSIGSKQYAIRHGLPGLDPDTEPPSTAQAHPEPVSDADFNAATDRRIRAMLGEMVCSEAEPVSTALARPHLLSAAQVRPEAEPDAA
ncbi:MAG: hypothetical protein AAF152_02455 [Cyanobacteria bacterium P01_A01_bin.114]